MKKIIINNCIKYIQKYNDYSETKIEEIKYGLEAIYLTLTKFIFISIVALIFGIFKEMLIFTIIYNIIRMPSFGLHATKSWICLISSTILFIGIPYLCIILNIPIIIKILICSVGLIFMFKNSPADTYKRPIVSKKRRKKYKFISVLFTLIYLLLCAFIKNNFISNCFMLSIILQNLLISPIVYKIFKLPYNNYITFLKEHPEFAN